MPIHQLDEAEIFNAARQLTSAERADFLHETCAGNAELEQNVRRLLAAYDEQPSFLNGVTAEQSPPTGQPGLIGTIVGNFKLLELIGEGGMGLVYMAEQQQPVRRLVALKLVKPGMDRRQVIARFEAERQALAMMDHANIAKVLDAGTTETGRPYFVMELVRGLPITEFCDHKRLNVRQRLELFIQVCQAVQHAHQKGIIHRDLKPTNVLVTMHDATPVPKIIDFGIAKALGQSLTEHTLHTGFAQLMGTPLYMSPEQAEMNQLGVDTRSDVYSLGVILYELLTGTTPFDKERLKSAGFDEMRRIIREEEPETVSKRMSRTLSSRDRGATTGMNAGIRHAAFRARHFLELDWIVGRCLEKDRNRRYDSASALAEDLRRNLADEPVQVCPPSAAYRFGKFARRHRVALATTAAVGAALVLGLALSTWQSRRAWRAEKLALANEARAVKGEKAARQEQANALAAVRAEKIQRDLTEANLRQALTALDQSYLRVAERLTASSELSADDRQLLNQMLVFYEDFARRNAASPRMLAARLDVCMRIGKVHEDLGQYAQAEAAYRQGLKVGAELIAMTEDNETEKVANRRALEYCVDRLATLLMRDPTKREQALQQFEKSLRELELLQTRHPKFKAAIEADVARCLLHQATTLFSAGDRLRAALVFIRAEELLRQIAKTPTLRDWAHTSLALVLKERGRLLLNDDPRDARRLLEEADGYQRAELRRSPKNELVRAELGSTLELFGEVLQRLSEDAEAENAFVAAAEALETAVKAFPGVVDHQAALSSAWTGLGVLRANSKRPQEAEEAFRRSIKLDEKLSLVFAEEKSRLERLSISHFNLGNVLVGTGRKPEAEQEYRWAIATAEKCGPSGRAALSSAVHNLGTLLYGKGQKEEAGRLFFQAVETDRELVKQAPENAQYRYSLGIALTNWADFQHFAGQEVESVALLEEAIEGLAWAQNAQPWNRSYRDALLEELPILIDWLNDAQAEEVRDPSHVVKLAGKALAFADRLSAQKLDAATLLPVAEELGAIVPMLEQRREWGQSAAVARRAIEFTLPTVDAQPSNQEQRGLLANYYAHLALALSKLQQTQEAENAYRQNLVHAEKLYEGDPQNPEYQANLARDCVNWGGFLLTNFRRPEAEAPFERARELLKKLVSAPPDNPRIRNLYAATLHNLSEIVWHRGEADRAVALVEAAIGQEQAALKSDTTLSYVQLFLRNHYCNLAEYLANHPDPDKRDPKRAEEAARNALEFDPPTAAAYVNLGIAQYRAGDWKAADDSLRQGIKLRGDGDEDGASFFLAMTQWKLGEQAPALRTTARQTYGQAAAWMKQNPQKAADLRRYQTEAAELLKIDKK